MIGVRFIKLITHANNDVYILSNLLGTLPKGRNSPIHVTYYAHVYMYSHMCMCIYPKYSTMTTHMYMYYIIIVAHAHVLYIQMTMYSITTIHVPSKVISLSYMQVQVYMYIQMCMYLTTVL